MNTSYIAITVGLSPDNVETIYNKRLQKYYFDHSREVKFTPDPDGIFFLEYGTQGNILNAEFDKIYKTGVPIPEEDFIKQQLKSIEKIPLIGLKQHHKALLSYYKNYLDLRLNATNEPQQSIETKPDKELHNNIFKGNAILLFKYYYESKSMVNNSRTHFRFLFEVMKKDGFIYDTVTLGQYVKFIHKEFGYVDNELKTINLNSTPSKNNLKDYKQYKDNLQTTLK